MSHMREFLGASFSRPLHRLALLLPLLLLVCSGTALALPRFIVIPYEGLAIVVPFDQDGDNVKDADERNVYGTDPKNPDTDGDGLTDGAEILTYGTDPKKADTDTDGLADGDELRYGTNPKNPDTDGDGILDGPDVLRTCTSDYDTLGRLKKIQSSAGGSIEYIYDPDGNPIKKKIVRP